MGTERTSVATSGFSLASAWTPAGIPVAGDICTIISPHTISATGANIVAGIAVKVANGATLALGNNKQYYGTILNSGTISEVIPIFTNYGNIIISKDGTVLTDGGSINEGLIIVEGGGALTLGNGSYNGDINNGAIIVQNGGAFSFDTGGMPGGNAGNLLVETSGSAVDPSTTSFGGCVHSYTNGILNNTSNIISSGLGQRSTVPFTGIVTDQIELQTDYSKLYTTAGIVTSWPDTVVSNIINNKNIVGVVGDVILPLSGFVQSGSPNYGSTSAPSSGKYVSPSPTGVWQNVYYASSGLTQGTFAGGGGGSLTPGTQLIVDLIQV